MRKGVKSSLLYCFQRHEIILNGVLPYMFPSFTQDLYGHSQLLPQLILRLLQANFIRGNYPTKVYNIIIQSHPNTQEYHLLNDRFGAELSVTVAEHYKKCSVCPPGQNIFSSSNFAGLPSRKFNSFVENAEHKIRLQEFLLMEVQSFARDQQRKFIYDLNRKDVIQSIPLK